MGPGSTGYRALQSHWPKTVSAPIVVPGSGMKGPFTGLQWDSSRVLSTSWVTSCGVFHSQPLPQALAQGCRTLWHTQHCFSHYTACDAITVINWSPSKSWSPADSPCFLPCGVCVPGNSWRHPLITLPSDGHPGAHSAMPTHSSDCSSEVRHEQTNLTKAARAHRYH